MAIHPQQGSLIQTLQKLYSRMVLYALHPRSGHAKHRLVRRDDSDIATPLYDYIDEIASSAQTRDKSEKIKVIHPVVAGQEVKTTRSGDNSKADVHPVLAGYFEGRKAATLLIPEIGEKLKISTWEHLHETIRFGRMGDIKNAKLHADLANGTLKEALQYMSRKEFQGFLSEIEKKFNDVLAESKH